MTQSDPTRSLLDALWEADEPPARDHAFAAATLVIMGPARMGLVGARMRLLRRTLTGLGVGGAVAGAVLMVQFAGVDTWSMALIGAALTVALWTGGRLVAIG